MRRMPLKCLILTLLLPACAGPRVDLEAETAALRTRSEGVVAAEKSQDADAASAFYAEDAVILPSGAPVMNGRAAMRELYSQMFTSGTVKAFESGATTLEVAASGDIAYEHGFNRMTLNTPDGEMLDVGKYLAVWKKRDGIWLVAALAFNSDAAAPTPTAPATPAPTAPSR